MRFIQSRAPVQQEAEEKIAEIARRIRGDEILRLGEAESTNLHKLLYDAGPDLAKAILAILALAGDRRSLKVAETMSNRTGEAYLFAAGSYESVRQEAARAAAKLRERIELARRSSTLLRPSSSTAEQELLRPEPSPGGGTPEGLLRPAPDRVED